MQQCSKQSGLLLLGAVPTPLTCRRLRHGRRLSPTACEQLCRSCCCMGICIRCLMHSTFVFARCREPLPPPPWRAAEPCGSRGAGAAASIGKPLAAAAVPSAWASGWAMHGPLPAVSCCPDMPRHPGNARTCWTPHAVVGVACGCVRALIAAHHLPRSSGLELAAYGHLRTLAVHRPGARAVVGSWRSRRLTKSVCMPRPVQTASSSPRPALPRSQRLHTPLLRTACQPPTSSSQPCRPAWAPRA